MRVGIDYRPALVNREGIGRYTRELVRALVELSFDANLGLFGYTLAARRFSLEQLGLAGTRAELLRLRLPSRWMPWLLKRLGKGVDDLVGGADVYHHTQYNALAVREAVEVATLHDCIYMLDVGYMDPRAAETMATHAKALAKRARRILVPSEFVGAEVVMNFGVWPERVAVTPLGCDHVARSIPPEGFPPPKEPYVLTASRVDARKNHVRMLAAFERLVTEGFPHRWIIVGPEGYGADDFRRALANSSARARVEWRREVDDDELVRLMSGADVFLFASLNEGFGLPPLEAMATETAVVTSCVTSMPEVAGNAALCIEPTDVDAIFDAVRGLLQDPEARRDLATRGGVRARHFTWRETARQTLLAYQKVLEPGDEDRPGLRRSL